MKIGHIMTPISKSYMKNRSDIGVIIDTLMPPIFI